MLGSLNIWMSCFATQSVEKKTIMGMGQKSIRHVDSAGTLQSRAVFKGVKLCHFFPNLIWYLGFEELPISSTSPIPQLGWPHVPFLVVLYNQKSPSDLGNVPLIHCCQVNCKLDLHNERNKKREEVWLRQTHLLLGGV